MTVQISRQAACQNMYVKMLTGIFMGQLYEPITHMQKHTYVTPAFYGGKDEAIPILVAGYTKSLADLLSWA